jgi:hypothetical protein
VPAPASARLGAGAAQAPPRAGRRSRLLRLYGPALVPLLPLIAIVALLAGVAVRQPTEGPPAYRDVRLVGGRPAAAPASGAAPTPLGAELALRERALGIPPAQRWVVVVDTEGAGVFLRNTPNLADRKAVVPEGALMLEVGPSPDPAWRHVSLAPGGPVGWVPAQYLRLVP